MTGSVVWVDVLPSLNKFGGKFVSGVASAARGAGVSAGRQFSAGINAGAMKGTADALAKELEVASKRVARAVQTEKAAIQKARADEKAASVGVQAAEARLAEQRTKYAATSSQALKAEQGLVTARSRQEQMGLRVVSVEDRLKAAINEQKAVTGQLASAQGRAVKTTTAMRGGFTDLATAGAPLSAGLGKIAGGTKRIAANALATVKPLAGMAAGFGAILGVSKVIELGNDYTRTMNELQAVAGLTTAQMGKFSKATRVLGSDLSLPATSGKDAADVMLQLAKGGLTANEALKAARGTIVLAAAAQVSGAEAAEIQSNSLNQFGLSASKAGHVADVLANTANAASGGITDIAYSMKYAGGAARAVGADIDSTSAAIGVLANMGQKGETAGTSLRSMLASLASPSKIAQKGLDGLGVEAFDASGKFLGLRSVIQQLSAAQKKMSQAEFLDFVKKAFGKETLTSITNLAQAGVSGSKGYDAMFRAVSRTGGAATVAASYMKGLGGATDKLESQLQDVALVLYQTAAPALTDFVNGIATGLDGAGAKVEWFIGVAGGLSKLAFTGKVSAPISGIDPKVVAGIQAARGVIVKAYDDIVVFTRDQLVPSFRDLAVAVGPLAAVVGGVFLGAFRAAAFVLAHGIGPALVATTGFMREHKSVAFLLAGMIGTLVLAYKAQQTQLLILEAGGMAKYLRATKLGVFWTNTQAASLVLWRGALLATKGAIKLAAALQFTGVAATKGWTYALHLNKGAQITNATATGAATGATWAFNAALSANPIGLIVIGIVAVVAALAALVAGVIYAYKHWTWFRTAVDAVWDGIQTGAKAVGAAAVWLWRTAFVPALNGIGTAASWLWGTILKPFLDGVVLGAKAVGSYFVFMYQQVSAALSAIGRAVSYLYTNYVDPIFQLIGAIVMKLVVPVFLFLWANVVKPVLGLIGLGITTLWTTSKATFGFLVSFIRATVGAVFMWLWSSVISPVFGWIGDRVKLAMTGVRIILAAIGLFVRATFAPAFTWLYDNIIKPVFDKIGAVVRVTWNGWLKPVFDKVINVAKVAIPAAFSVMKDGIAKAWDLVKKSVKEPIRFVVDTVINDALIGNFNKAADFFGTKKMPKVSLPKGFADGGYTGAGAKYEPAGIVHKDEYVLTKEETSRLGVGRIKAFAEGRLPGYANGGLVGAATGAWDWIAGKAGKAVDWAKDAAGTAASVVSDPMGTIGALVKGAIGKIPGAGGMLDVAKGLGSKVLTGVIDKLKGLGGAGDAGVFGGNGANGNIPSSALGKANGFAPGPGVNASGGLLRKAAAAAWNAASAASGGMLRLTEGYRDLKAQQYRWSLFKKGGNLAAAPGTSKHGLGDAADVAGGQAWLRANGARFGWQNTGLGFSQREPWHFEYKGAPAGGSGGGQVPLYDNGGYLPPGLSLVANNTGRPEPVLTGEQFEALRGGGGRDPREVHFHHEGRDFTIEDFMEAEHRMEVLRG